MDCPICLESSQDTIKCCGCAQSFCRVCCEQYLLSLNGNPVCPLNNCKTIWSRDYIYKINSREFISKWVKKRQNDLFKRELLLMSATTILVANHREADEKRKKSDKLRKEIRELSERIVLLREKASHLENEATALEAVKLVDIASTTPNTRRCFTINCRGYLDEKNLQCTVCDSKYCKHCNVLLSSEQHVYEQHVCEQIQVESVAYIEATSKMCPTCSTLISKTEGCDQMYCVVCDTPFSWKTGKVESGFIHNPHYLRKMEAGGHVPRAPVGDELPPWRDLADMIPCNEKSIRGFFTVVYDLLAKQTSLFTPVNNDYERAQMLINKMTEEKFKSVIQLKEKHWLLSREIAKTTDTLLHVGCMLFWKKYANEITLPYFSKKIEEMRIVANEELLQLSHNWDRLCVPLYSTEFEVKKQHWVSDK